MSAVEDRCRTKLEAECVVKGDKTTVVAAVDESVHADAVFDFVSRHFDHCGTAVVFVFVVSPGDESYKSFSAEANLAQSKKYLVDGWVKRAQDLKMSFNSEGHVLTGDPREELLLFCEHLRPDMMVMGSRGRGSITRAMLGSVSDYLVHNCPCPVIVVKKGKEEEGEAQQKGRGIYNAFFSSMMSSFRRRAGEVPKEGGGGGDGKGGEEVVVEEEALREETSKEEELGEQKHGGKGTALEAAV